MTTTITNARVYKKVAAGFRFQVAKGTPATVNQFIKEADVTINPGVIEFDPQGTHGSRYQAVQGMRVAYTEPTATIQGWLSRTMAAYLLEGFTGGRPTCSGSQYSAPANTITGAVITGIRPMHHCNNLTTCMVTMVVATMGGGLASKSIKFYSNSGATSQIASGHAAAGAAFSAAAIGTNSLIVTGTLAAAVTNGTKEIAIKETTCNFADDVHSLGYLTFALDTGQENYKMSDCYIKRMKLSTGGREGIRFEIELAGMTFAEAGSTLTASITDNEFMVARDVTLTYDAAGGNDSLPMDGGFDLEGNYDIKTGPDNASTPEYIRRDGLTLAVGVTCVPSDETNTLLDNARATTFKTLALDMSYGSYGLTMDFGDVLAEPNTLVAVSGRAVNNLALKFRARADMTDTTPSLATIKIQWRA